MSFRWFYPLLTAAVMGTGAAPALAQDAGTAGEDDFGDEGGLGDEEEAFEEEDFEDDGAFGEDAFGDDPDAEATESGPEAASAMPVPMAQRGLTLPAGTVRIDANFDLFDLTNDFGAALSAGGAVGIIENLDAGMLLLPIVFAPEGGFGDIRMFGKYRFWNGDTVEVAGRLELVLPSDSTNLSTTDFSLSFGAPVRIHLGDTMRIDTGVEFSLALLRGPTGDTIFGIAGPQGFPLKRHALSDRSVAGVPLMFTINVTDAVYLGARTGVGIADFGNADDTTFIPLGFSGGYTVAGESGPLVDITARFRWPNLYTSGGMDDVQADIYEVVLAGEVYLHDLF
jgi:hypothetical protein